MPIGEIRERIKDKIPNIDLNNPNTDRVLSGGSFVIRGAFDALYGFFKIVVTELINLVKQIKW